MNTPNRWHANTLKTNALNTSTTAVPTTNTAYPVSASLAMSDLSVTRHNGTADGIATHAKCTANEDGEADATDSEALESNA